MNDEQLQTIMSLIVNAGNAKSCAMEAIAAAKDKNFEVSEEKLAEANQALVEAHHMQTQMLTDEANGKNDAISLLTVHSQDHLMTGISFTETATELVEIYRVLDRIMEKVGGESLC